jgi:hypothetical protein
MTYKNSREEKQALQKRLKMAVAGGTSLRKLQRDFAEWADKNKSPSASRETLDNWMCSDLGSSQNLPQIVR